MPAQFQVHAADLGRAALLQRELALPRFVALTLVGRGIDAPEAAREFLNPSLERDWRNPYEIPGMSAVADALERAIRENKRILVFGDFDLDGVSASTVLTRGLRALGAYAVPFIPRRFEEGYGMSDAAIERMMEHRPDFVVTVDCGIAGKEEVKKILAAGIEVAVTDHHEAADLVPEGIPVADPKLDAGCRSDILAGVGVALKLVQILGSRMGYPHLWRSYTDFAAMGTVADLMPMIGENRALVADGLSRINENPRPCIAALIGTAGFANEELTATNLSFSLIPRLNAAGRMGDAQLALDLLMCDNFHDACALARQLEEINDQRRAIEMELSEQAQEVAKGIYHGQRALVVAGTGWHEGVKGIVASRLVSAYGVPSFLFTIEGDEARGSGRSVGSVNLFAAVESAADLTIRFGGHEAAVGVTLPKENLGAFADRVCAYMDELPEDAFHPLVTIDASVDLDELTLENVQRLDELAPFGQENPVPTYLARNVTLTRCRAVGTEKNHLSCMLSNGRSALSAIMFHCDDIAELLETDSVVDAAFSVQIDEWRGRKSVKAMLETLAPAHSCAALEACLNPADLDFFERLYATGDERLFPEDMLTQRRRDKVASAEEERRRELALRRAHWEQEAKRDPEALENAIVHAIIGDRALHSSQRAVLDKLRAGVNIMAIMATGRGKSLTFQVYAAWLALTSHKASLFVYPLRALIADQAFHLSAALEPFGISVSVLTGESTPEERAEVFGGLFDGSQDIVLTTPEFLVYHQAEFAETDRISFVVVDEAHHIGLAHAGHRTAYTELGEALSRLGAPLVLALSATVDDRAAEDIDRTLSLDESVVDDTARDNLSIEDRRNIKNRDDYLANLVAQGEKTVIYVNSREQSVALARMLRRRVPQLASLIGFYNGGLTRLERKRIEELFRTDALTVLVATSAFGEGVDIPNIRHVVLYHLPFNEVEFNQMSGRAGRDGKPATVHLLYGRGDVAINERILSDLTPDHDVMAQVYRRLRACQREAADDFFPMGNALLARLSSDARHPVSPLSASCGVAVFRELGLIETKTGVVNGEATRFIHVNEQASKVELTDSVRYREGLGERDVFSVFRDWAMRSDTQSLRIRVSHPIVPHIRGIDF